MKVWFPLIRVGSGSDVYTERLARALERYGITAEVDRFDSWYELSPWLLRYRRPPQHTCLIHANSWNGFAFKRDDVPLVVTVHHSSHDPEFHRYKSILQRMYHATFVKSFECASLSRAAAVVAVSHYAARSIQDAVGIAATDVIHNWIDTELYKPLADFQGDGEGRKRTFTILYVGNLRRAKGVDLLPRIMAALGQKFQLRYTRGMRKGDIVHRTANMIPLDGLAGESLIKEYQSCDALLFPSRSEGFGLVALEAMACGKPVIASRASALTEVVADGETGILCPLDDVDAFASACRRLAADPQLCSVMGANARRRAVDYFSEERIIPQYAALYERLVAKSNRK